MAEKKERLNKKLAAYSAAAAAALAMAPATANALVVYSGPMNLSVNTGTSQLIDMNGDAAGDFQFNATNFYYSSFWYFQSVSMSLATNGISHINEWTNYDPANLPYGYSVQASLAGPTNYWSNDSTETLNGTWSGSTSTAGNFNGATGYIGVSFLSACGTTYGWIQYQGLTPSTGTVIDWAYEDVCGQPIMAGAIAGGAPHVVPTMGEWGMLLLAGLLSAAAIKAVNREEETA